MLANTCVPQARALRRVCSEPSPWAGGKRNRSMSSLRVVSGLAIAVSLTAVQAYAQSMAVVGPQRRVNPVGSTWRECSVAVRFSQPNEVVVAANRIGSQVDPDVGYGVTLNGGVTFLNGNLLLGLDPGVSADPVTGRMWISAKACGVAGIGVVYKGPGSTTFSDICCAVQDAGILDKPLMGIGPDGRHFLSYTLSQHSGCDHGLWTAGTDTPTECSWPTPIRMEPVDYPGDCRWSGLGATPVVLSTGRVVVVNQDYDQPEGGWAYNDGLPFVVYSNDDGFIWLPIADTPVRAVEGATIQVAKATDTPYGIDRGNCMPAIAVDPSNDDVYVAFYARADMDPTGEGDRNTDIYISQSLDGGQTFPGDPDSNQVLCLSDLMLTGEEGGFSGPDQVMPAIAVDACGGVDVLFYDDRNDPDFDDLDHWYDLYFVRIIGFGTPQQAIQQVRLTPQSFLLTPAAIFLGDYHHMAAAPPGPVAPIPTVYPAYIAMAKDGNNQWTQQNCYMHKIQILCTEMLGSWGDASSDSLFERLCSEGALDGDLNGDGVVDDLDAQVFCESYESMEVSNK